MRHNATDVPFCFRTLVRHQVVYDRTDRRVVRQCGDSISIRCGVRGGMMSLELTITDRITMVGFDDGVLM